MNRALRYAILYLLIFFVIVGIFATFNTNNTPTKNIRYDEFMTSLSKGDVTSFSMQPEQGVYFIEGSMKGYEEGEKFLTKLPYNSEKVLERIDSLATANNVQIDVIETSKTSGWVQFFTGLLPFLIIIILFFFLLSQSQGGGNRVMNFGKSKAKLYDNDKKK